MSPQNLILANYRHKVPRIMSNEGSPANRNMKAKKLRSFFTLSEEPKAGLKGKSANRTSALATEQKTEKQTIDKVFACRKEKERAGGILLTVLLPRTGQ